MEIKSAFIQNFSAQRRGTILLSLSGLIVLGVGCSRRSADDADRPTVAVTKVVRADVAKELTFQAEFRPWFAVDLHPQVSGFVRSLAVDIGNQVKAGQLLAQLEIPLLKEDLARGDASLRRSMEDAKRAQAAYDETHMGYTRLQAVAKAQPKLLAQQDLDAAVAKDQGAAAAVAGAQEQVQVAQAELDRFRAQERYTKLIAPFDGVITRLDANPGDVVQGGTVSGQGKSLVRLVQMNKLRLTFPISVSYVAFIHEGDSVEIRLDDGRKLKSTIARMSREVSMTDRMMEAEADIPNDDLSLTPGIYATAVLKPEHHENTLVVPIEAVNRKQQPTVFIVNGANEIEERAVKLGLETPLRWEVLEGLHEGDLVLVAGGSRVKAGQKVKTKMIPTLAGE